MSKKATLNKVISLCEQHGFFRSTKSPPLLQVESTGALLLENLRNEWFNNVVINKDLSVFMCSNNLEDTYNFAKKTCLEKGPFAICKLEEKELCKEEKEERIDFRDFFHKGVEAQCSVFANPEEATPFFHQWQRERRMWWRKFSASPGRYILTDIKTESDNSETVDIFAKYPWGQQLLEQITLTNNIPGLENSQLQLKSGRKEVQASCISSKVCFSSMLLNSLCDAFDESPFKNEPRPLLLLHRKLAPYKIAFSIPSAQKAIVDELKDLALYICRQLRTNHISCLLLPSSYKVTLEAQFKQYDQMGIPYTVILNENTLKNGIALLRDRNTTLKEQTHVSNLPVYVEQLFKNY